MWRIFRHSSRERRQLDLDRDRGRCAPGNGRRRNGRGERGTDQPPPVPSSGDRRRPRAQCPDPARSPPLARLRLQLVQAIAIALAASLMTYVITRGWPRIGDRRPRRQCSSCSSVRPSRAHWRAPGRVPPPERFDPGSFRGDAHSPAVRPLGQHGDLSTRLFGGEHPDTVPAVRRDLVITRDDHDDGVIEPEERKMIDNVYAWKRPPRATSWFLASTSSPSPRTPRRRTSSTLSRRRATSLAGVPRHR